MGMMRIVMGFEGEGMGMGLGRRRLFELQGGEV